MFNDYIWQTYLNAGGQAVVEMFKQNLSEEYTKEYAENIEGLHKAYCPSEFQTSYINGELNDLFKDLKEGIWILVFMILHQSI